MSNEQKPTNKSIFEGSIAQILGGSVAATIVGIFEAFGHYLPAKLESGFGTVFSIIAYIVFKKLR